MADGFIGIGTYRDDDVSLKIVDGASGNTATNKLTIAKTGDAVAAGTNDFGIPALVQDEAGDYALLIKTANGLAVDVINDVSIRQLVHTGATPDSVQIGDGTEVMAVSADGEASVQISQAQGAVGAAAPLEAVQMAGQDSDGNLQTISLDSNGRQEVVIKDAGTPICEYNAFGGNGVANNVTENFDYIVTSAKVFQGKNVSVGADGKVLVEVGTYDGTTFTIKKAWFQQPAENVDHDISALLLTGDGTNAIRVAVTGKQGFSSDVRATIQGLEV